MSTKRISLAEASDHLPELIDEVQGGDEVVIEAQGKAPVKLVVMPRTRKPRVLGLHEGLVDIAENFNAPLPANFWLGGKP